MVNKNLISESQTEYVIGIMNLIMGSHDSLIRFPMFCAIAALSERIVALESTVAHCINKMDLTALKAKLAKARDMFLVNDTDRKVCLSFFPVA